MNDATRATLQSIIGHLILAHQQHNAAMAQLTAAETKLDALLNPPKPTKET